MRPSFKFRWWELSNGPRQACTWAGLPHLLFCELDSQSRELRPQRSSGLNASTLWKKVIFVKGNKGISPIQRAAFLCFQATTAKSETNDPSVLGQVALSHVRNSQRLTQPCPVCDNILDLLGREGVLEETVCIRLALGHLCER